ncbi:GFA family protein [Pseudovibrio sp. Ad26]|uniref:GFA family protein n=1 Tax=Pseudovibrio sp. Ad26 TaxID=989410 RepID=UPI0007AE468F|nr:GFA family protein [Pseudovibrio sp. Ad26]KZK96867.1 Glutathione-dependent formaldehyde-activating enzyme [Pseudovibrio sp. Ad26]
MTEQLTGGCACGAVRYEAKGEIEFSFNCHCRKCQRSTGTGHSSAFAIDVAGIQFQGEVREHKAISDNGAATYSGFCPTCGSPLTSRTERFPNRIYIHAATLDDPSHFSPSVIVFEEAAQPWDPPIKNLEAAPK